jgi:hypothetical protein
MEETMIRNLSNILSEIFPHAGDVLPEQVKKVYPTFNAYISVIKARPPRHSYFEWFIDMGRGDIDSVFSGELFTKKELVFVFPERWMSVHEQRAFMNVLRNHPSQKKIETVLIATSSPIMVSDFFKEQVRIISFNDDRMDF